MCGQDVHWVDRSQGNFLMQKDLLVYGVQGDDS